MAKCPNEPTLGKRLDEIEKMKTGAKDAILHVDPKLWCRAYFSYMAQCDAVDNNTCEAFNFILISARSKPIISMLEEMRDYVFERNMKRRLSSSRWKEEYGHLIMKEVHEKIRESYPWKVMCNGDEGYQVSIGRSQYAVNL